MGLVDDELQTLVSAWRASNPKIVRLWWDVDLAAMTAVKERTTAKTHGIRFLTKAECSSLRFPPADGSPM